MAKGFGFDGILLRGERALGLAPGLLEVVRPVLVMDGEGSPRLPRQRRPRARLEQLPPRVRGGLVAVAAPPLERELAQRIRPLLKASYVATHQLGSWLGHPTLGHHLGSLAIHHEHRMHNLEEARRHAQGALASEQDPVEAEALRHRIARLDRKLGQG